MCEIVRSKTEKFSALCYIIRGNCGSWNFYHGSKLIGDFKAIFFEYFFGNGSNDILFSVWNGDSWSSPQIVSRDGEDLGDGSARVARVNNQNAAVVWLQSQVPNLVDGSGKVRTENLLVRATLVRAEGSVLADDVLGDTSSDSANVEPDVSFSPSGDGVGRMEPPAPVTKRSLLPLWRSSR